MSRRRKQPRNRRPAGPGRAARRPPSPGHVWSFQDLLDWDGDKLDHRRGFDIAWQHGLKWCSCPDYRRVCPGWVPLDRFEESDRADFTRCDLNGGGPHNWVYDIEDGEHAACGRAIQAGLYEPSDAPGMVQLSLGRHQWLCAIDHEEGLPVRHGYPDEACYRWPVEPAPELLEILDRRLSESPGGGR